MVRLCSTKAWWCWGCVEHFSYATPWHQRGAEYCLQWMHLWPWQSKGLKSNFLVLFFEGARGCFSCREDLFASIYLHNCFCVVFFVWWARWQSLVTCRLIVRDCQVARYASLCYMEVGLHMGFYLQDTDCGDVKLQWLFGYPSSAFGVNTLAKFSARSLDFYHPPTGLWVKMDQKMYQISCFLVAIHFWLKFWIGAGGHSDQQFKSAAMFCQSVESMMSFIWSQYLHCQTPAALILFGFDTIIANQPRNFMGNASWYFRWAVSQKSSD